MQEDLVENCIGALLAASVSVSSYELCSADLKTFFSQCPPSTLTFILFPLRKASLRSGGKDLMETSSLELCFVLCSLSFCVMSVWVGLGEFSVIIQVKESR